MGRPSDYTKELAEEICERLSLGETLRQISLLNHMPDRVTIHRWLIKNEEFRNMYAHAKEWEADFQADEMIDIADDGRNDWEERENHRTGQKYIALNDECVRRSQLRIDTRKWLMSKTRPRKYGEKLDLTTDGNPINLTLAVSKPVEV